MKLHKINTWFALFYNRFSTPITFNAGDEIRVDCTFQSRRQNTTTHYGEGTSDEMCFAFLTYYPANDNFSYCLQWRSIDACSNVPIRCDLPSFQQLAPAVSTVCGTATKSCSNTCRLLMASLVATECLTGEMGEFLSGSDTQGFMALYALMTLCDISANPVTTTTSYPIPVSRSSPASVVCDVATFIRLGELLPVICSTNNCSNACKLTVMAMTNLGCMTGESYQYLLSNDRNGMMWLYGLINWCGIPMSTTISPTRPPTVSGTMSVTSATTSSTAIVTAASFFLFRLLS